MASLPSDDLSEEIRLKAEGLGMDPDVYLRWLIDPEKRKLITYLELAEASGVEGASVDAIEFLAGLRSGKS